MPSIYHVRRVLAIFLTYVFRFNWLAGISAWISPDLGHANDIFSAAGVNVFFQLLRWFFEPGSERSHPVHANASSHSASCKGKYTQAVVPTPKCQTER